MKSNRANTRCSIDSHPGNILTLPSLRYGANLMRKLLRIPALFMRLILEDVFSLDLFANYRDNVVFVKLDAIGDFIVWLGFVPTLRKHYQSQHLVLVCNKVVSELALNTGLFDTVVPLDLKRFQADWIYRFRILRRIRKIRCITAIQPTHSRRFLLGESIIRCSGAQKRIGFLGDTSNCSNLEKWLADRWYTKLVPTSTETLTEHEQHLVFLRSLGISKPRLERLSLPTAAWPSGFLQPNGPYLVLFPGAGAALRRWPVEKFSEIAHVLSQRYHLQIVICGSFADIEQSKTLVNELAPLNVINLCGATSLPELIGVISRSHLLLSNETSAIHIAAATVTPSVCFLGGGHYGRFMPYPSFAAEPRPIAVYSMMPCFHCNWQCIYPIDNDQPAPCIEAISFEAALQAAEQALRGGCSPEPSL